MIDRKAQGLAVLCGAAVDAQELLVPWADPAPQWGLGVFETVAVRDALPEHLEAHLARLDAAALKLGVSLPTSAELAAAARTVAAARTDAHAWLKIVASRSGRWAVFAGPLDAAACGAPVSAVVLAGRRHRLDPTVGIKSIGYAASILGLEEAARRGADEGFWLNDRGHVIGACTGNAFAARGRSIVTPALPDGARDGVTRARAIEALRALGLTVHVGKLRIKTLRAADEVFLTSSLRGIRPVTRIDGREVRGGRPGPIAGTVAERLERESRMYDAPGPSGR